MKVTTINYMSEFPPPEKPSDDQDFALDILRRRAQHLEREIEIRHSIVGENRAKVTRTLDEIEELVTYRRQVLEAMAILEANRQL